MKFSIKSKIKKYITYLKYVTSVWSSTVQQSMCCMRLCMPILAPSSLGSRIQVEMKKHMYCVPSCCVHESCLCGKSSLKCMCYIM